MNEYSVKVVVNSIGQVTVIVTRLKDNAEAEFVLGDDDFGGPAT